MSTTTLDGCSLIRFVLDVHEIGGAVLDVDAVDRTLARRHEMNIHKIYMTPRVVEGWTEVSGRSTISYHPIHYERESIQRDREMLIGRIRGQISALIERHQPDLLANHIPEIPTGVLVSRLARESGLPLFIQFHGGEIPRMRFSPHHQSMVDGVVRYFNESARLADVVSAVSDSAQRLVAGRKVVNLWTGVDASSFDPAKVRPGFLRDRFELSGNLPIVVLPARIVMEKGHQILLDACQLLFERGRDFRVVFVGSASHEIRAQLDGYIYDNGFSGIVSSIYDASQAEMRAIYRDADVVALPGYHFEGCPRSLLEAQLMEKPVIGSDAGGTAESFVDGTTGILFPVGDRERLADGLERLIVDPALRRRMGQAGRRFVAERFGLDALGDRHEAIYRRMMRRRVAVGA